LEHLARDEQPIRRHRRVRRMPDDPDVPQPAPEPAALAAAFAAALAAAALAAAFVAATA
jgi:hypothetical protein